MNIAVIPEPEPLNHGTPEQQARFEALMAIAEEFRKLPILDNRTTDEILGYDEFGLPT
jgi:hypothetical protein